MKMRISRSSSERYIRNPFRTNKTLRSVSRITLCLALLCQNVVFFGILQPAAAQTRRSVKPVRHTAAKTLKRKATSDKMEARAPGAARSGKSLRAFALDGDRQVDSEAAMPAAMAMVNFDQLAKQEAARAARQQTAGFAGEDTDEPGEVAPLPQTIDESELAANEAVPNAGEVSAPALNLPLSPSTASPGPSSSFLAQPDGARVGTSTFTIPPDTMGAVGLDKVLTHVNSNYRIQDKAGNILSTVSITTFWSAVGGTGYFDPRVQYDPYNNRWIVAAVSDAQTANSSVLIGVSLSSDPAGGWALYRFIVGSASNGGRWADFPMLGFNKNFVAAAWNEFNTTTGAFVRGRFIELDYPQVRAALPAPTGSIFNIGGAFCMHPATTLSPTENNLYFVVHLSSAGATYVLITLSGTSAAPSLAIGSTLVRPGGGWVQPGGDIVPQKCVAGGLACPGTIRGLDVGDSFIRNNVVFRNGKIYYAQTVGLGSPVTHTAAQWTVIGTNGAFIQGGRIEDPTATSTNGGKWYFYPSITVNKNEDVMLGFAVSSSNDFVSAAYSFRAGTDAAGTMRDPFIFKSGEDYYQKTFSGTRNRWGDYSHSVVDPSNDRDVWTIQEYAGLRTGTGLGSNDSRWSTWWAMVSVPSAQDDTAIVAEDSGANSINVLANDSDTSNTLSVSSVTQGAHGTVAITGGGTGLTYAPAANYNGPDSFTYTATNSGGLTATANVAVTVTPVNDPPVVTASPKTQSAVQYSDAISTVNISATDVETPAVNLSVAFSYSKDGGPSQSGLPTGMVQGGVGGAWTVSGVAGVAAGTYVIKASVTDTGDGAAAPLTTSDTFTIVVTREDAIAAPKMSNPTSMQVASPGGTASGTTGQICFDITEVADGSPGNTALINAATVSLSAVGGGSAASITPSSVSFSGGGVGLARTACFSLSLSNTPSNVYEVTLVIGGNFYQGSGTTAFTVYDPSSGFVTGGGWVLNPNTGYRANYGVNIKYLKNGNAQGSILYIEHRPDGDYKVKSNSLNSSGGLSIFAVAGGMEADVAGKATYTVNGLGGGNYLFITRVIDNGEPGSGDLFGLKLIDPNGQVVPDFTFDPVTLGGGNNQVPKK